MRHEGTTLTAAEWALWGPRKFGGYGLLDCSNGPIDRGELAEIIPRSLGDTPDPVERGLPRMIVGRIPRRPTQVGVTIQKLSADHDDARRPTAASCYFYFPYEQAGETLLSYEKLFDVFSECTLPSDGSQVRVDIQHMAIEAILERIDETAIMAAALLLTDNLVRVTQGEAVPLLQRLRFLDTVAASLPHSMRARLSV